MDNEMAIITKAELEKLKAEIGDYRDALLRIERDGCECGEYNDDNTHVDSCRVLIARKALVKCGAE